MKKRDSIEPKKPLYGMFTDIPPHYDLVNRLITFRMDKGWRKRAALACLALKPQKILDLCCGTGDLAIQIAQLANFPVEIEGLDYSQPMLDIALKKCSAAGKRIHFTQGDASRLPYKNAEFDCIGISFAFRNLTYKNSLVEAHLAEIVRVLKPGGKFVIVESSQPDNGLVRAFYHLHMRGYVANVGAWFSKNRPAYRYLAESACHYFSPAEMKEFLLRHGFKSMECKPLFLGSAAIYIATK